MSYSPDQRKPNPKRPDQKNLKVSSPKRLRPLSLPDILFKDNALKHVILKMPLDPHSRSSTPSLSPSTPSEPDLSVHPLTLDPLATDYNSLLSDALLLNIFSKLPISQHVSNSLVCKRWLYLSGRSVQSLKLSDWAFLDSGRVFQRFPNLIDIEIVRSCIRVPPNSGILVTHKFLSVHVFTNFMPNAFINESYVLSSNLIDRGLGMIAKKYPNLRRIVTIGASEEGLLSISNECHTLQELELHCCGDLSLKGISGCRNLQVVKLIGSVDGFYNSVISDIGLTILAQGCKRLVKLELCGCEGSYDGIKAIGQCCQMLEELTLSDHRMDGGWLAALSFCGNLKTLRLQSCKTVDSSPGPDEHLGTCLTLDKLHLKQCQLRDKNSVKALFMVCKNVREIVLQDCWGLRDDVFGMASICRGLTLLSLEHCSSLKIGGLESVILSCKELQRLRVVSCNGIKDNAITPELASLFSVLKELKWRPDSRSLLSSSLAGTGMGNRGGKFFTRLKA